MNIYLILIVFIKLVFSVQYNQPCTFSSDSCKWSIGRRWHIMNLDNNNKILIADAESKEDERNGFTDVIMTSWLYLSSLCSYEIRLTFRYTIQNQYDFLEIYFIEKSRTRMNLLGQWKSLINKNNSLDINDSIWQQGNVTFKASKEFQINFEVRHLPDTNNNSIVWFAIDDILIENCPNEVINTTNDTLYIIETTATIPILSTTDVYLNENNSTIFNTSSWKLDDLSTDSSSSSPRQTLLTLILYLFCALIALTLLIILFTILIFTYRKHCCSSSSSSTTIINEHRNRFNKNQLNNRIGIQIEDIDRDYQTVKTIDSTIRPCFE
ncbi:unnamed protein product [Adineta steineri]|uniref:MAM domain-containing protein n=1 Tax=Adineta steineri TaxID=433720 RepID=A0A815KBK4_9BILA|nr:unnamed protein product [Adineta steineri]CAF3597325.1 unnamed protein product [Adineta steineri]